MKIYIKNRTRRAEEFQFFMQDFVDACKAAGMPSKLDILPSYKFHIRAVLRKLLYFLFKVVAKFQRQVARHDKAILITSGGENIVDNSFPYFMNYEIVPIVWDIWPPSFRGFFDALENLNCKVVFVTVKSIAERVNKTTKVKAFWIPEGIKSSLYKKGVKLVDRKKDVFEMGRQHPKYHDVLNYMYVDGILNGYLTSNSKERKNTWLPFEEILTEIPKYKIMICFPRCDTNERAKGVETLTQRYWEAMLCGCLIVGRAPKELVDLCGYNPVIEVDWREPKLQMQSILTSIALFQPLVDKNYEFAKNNADWKYRIPKIMEILNQEGYNIK